MNARFTRIAVRKNSKAVNLVVGWPEIRNASPVLVTPSGAEIPLRGSMLAITAGHQTSDAMHTEGGTVFSIAAKDVRTDRYVQGDNKRPIETLRELFVRNPWNNSAAKKFVALFDVQS